MNDLYKKVSWRLIPFLLFFYLVSYLDRVNIGFAKLQMSADLGFSETVFGLGVGVYFISYVLFEIPSNIFMHKLGARIWFARIAITWGLISGAFMFVRSPEQFYILRFLLGLAESGCFPGIIYYLSCWYPAQHRAKVIALFMSGFPLAYVIGNPLSGWIMTAFNDATGMRGWQWMFMIEAIPAVIFGLIALIYLDDNISKAKWLTADEKQSLQEAITQDGQASVHTASIWDVLRDGRVWAMGLLYFAFNMTHYGVAFWAPTLIKEAGVSDVWEIGLWSVIPFGCAIIVMNLLGRNADATHERRWHLIAPAMMSVMGFSMIAFFAESLPFLLIALSFASAGAFTCVTLFWSLPTAFLSGSAAAIGIAFASSVGSLSGFVGSVLIGWLRDLTQGSEASMWMLVACALLGTYIVLKIPAKLVNR